MNDQDALATAVLQISSPELSRSPSPQRMLQRTGNTEYMTKETSGVTQLFRTQSTENDMIAMQTTALHVNNIAPTPIAQIGMTQMTSEFQRQELQAVARARAQREVEMIIELDEKVGQTEASNMTEVDIMELQMPAVAMEQPVVTQALGLNRVVVSDEAPAGSPLFGESGMFAWPTVLEDQTWDDGRRAM